MKYYYTYVLLVVRHRDTRYLIQEVKELSGFRHPASGIQKPTTSILLSSLAAFILHAQFEAWWVGVGSVQLPLFFVYVGLIVQSSTVQGS